MSVPAGLLARRFCLWGIRKMYQGPFNPGQGGMWGSGYGSVRQQAYPPVYHTNLAFGVPPSTSTYQPFGARQPGYTNQVHPAPPPNNINQAFGAPPISGTNLSFDAQLSSSNNQAFNNPSHNTNPAVSASSALPPGVGISPTAEDPTSFYNRFYKLRQASGHSAASHSDMSDAVVSTAVAPRLTETEGGEMNDAARSAGTEVETGESPVNPTNSRHPAGQTGAVLPCSDAADYASLWCPNMQAAAVDTDEGGFDLQVKSQNVGALQTEVSSHRSSAPLRKSQRSKRSQSKIKGNIVKTKKRGRYQIAIDDAKLRLTLSENKLSHIQQVLTKRAQGEDASVDLKQVHMEDTSEESLVVMREILEEEVKIATKEYEAELGIIKSDYCLRNGRRRRRKEQLMELSDEPNMKPIPQQEDVIEIDSQSESEETETLRSDDGNKQISHAGSSEISECPDCTIKKENVIEAETPGKAKQTLSAHQKLAKLTRKLNHIKKVQSGRWKGKESLVDMNIIYMEDTSDAALDDMKRKLEQKIAKRKKKALDVEEKSTSESEEDIALSSMGGPLAGEDVEAAAPWVPRDAADYSNMRQHGLFYRSWQDYPANEKLQGEDRKQWLAFTVASYNVLSQDLLEGNMFLYGHCQPQHLAWQYRRERVMDEISYHKPDIVCIQEVNANHYKNFFIKRMKQLGYGCTFKKRNGNKEDGCATFYNRKKLSLHSYTPVDYFRKGIPVLDRDNVGLISVFKPTGTHSHSDSSEDYILVANTHLLFNPKRGDVKLAQLMVLFSYMDWWASAYLPQRLPTEPVYCPIILCGDFNLEQDYPLYDFIVDGKLTYAKMQAMGMAGPYRGGGWNQLQKELIPKWEGITDLCQRSFVLQKRIKQYFARERLEKEPCVKQEPQATTSTATDDVVIVEPPPAGLADIKIKTEPIDVDEYSESVGTGSADEPLNIEAFESMRKSVFSSYVESDTVDYSQDGPFTYLFKYGSGTVEHRLQLQTAYSGFEDDPSSSYFGQPVVTTNHSRANKKVDFIFYSGQQASKRGKRKDKDGDLLLCSTLKLLTSHEMYDYGGLPNDIIGSDHHMLMAKFALKLKT